MGKTTLLFRKTYFTLSFLFLTHFGFAQTIVPFSSTTTWLCPAGVTQISIEAWGAGGAGGGATGSTSAGGGGAGGAYVKNTTLAVSAGSSYNITVGGTATGSTSTGQNGNPSSFALTATPAVLLINAVGGNGGAVSTLNSDSANGGTAVSTGNIGGTTFNIYGSAGSKGTGASGSKGGDGGNSGGGALGGAGSTSNASGAAGSNYGGGGAGARRTTSGTRNGGNGATGQVIITYDSPKINLSGNSIAIANNDSTPLATDGTDFGLNYTNASLSHTYTIQNKGNLPLTIGTITLSDLTNYSLTGPLSSTLAPGASTTFTVTFNTATAGLKSATITIANNDSVANPFKFTIQGTGVVAGSAQKMQVSGNTITIPNSNYFISTTDGTYIGDTFNGTAITQTYTIKNLGVATLTLTLPITFSGTNATEFTILTPPSTSILGGASTTFVVQFLPTAIGVRNARITIVNNDTSVNKSFNFAIQGTSFTSNANPEIDVQGNSISIASGSTVPNVNNNTDFGSNQINTSLINTFTIQNQGTSDLSLTGSPIVSITPTTDFTVITSPTTPLTKLGKTTFSIQFNPSSTGTKTATVSIANNDTTGSEDPYTFKIQGLGTQNFYDSDGDGIYDNVDVDDDNDGILDTTEEANCNLSNGHKVNYKFLNETFGTGPRTTISTTYAATTTYIFQDGTTPTSAEGSASSLDLNDGKYTVGPSAQITSWGAQFWHMGGDHTGDTNGRMAIFNASFSPGIFYTASITGVLPNIPTTYSFWVLNLDRTDAPDVGTRLRPNIRVEFRDLNDNILQTVSTGAIPPTTAGNLAGDWHQFTANLTFNVTAFKVVFINNETGGIGNDLAIDDISISQTLCDFDGDGIPDLFDLDSDNDGIPDVVEAGLGSLSNGTAHLNVTPLTDPNRDGLLDAAAATAALPALDSDGDGQPNYIDLDSDNDSVFDVDESGAGNTLAAAGFENGDGDINGDGVGDGPESEAFRLKDSNGDGTLEYFGDGILDIYDYGNKNLADTFANQYGNLSQGIANANPATTYLKDTDGDGIPDYLDTTSKGPGIYDIDNNKLIYNKPNLDSDVRGVINKTTDLDHDGIPDLFDTNNKVMGSPRDINTKLYLDFDGRNDYGQSTTVLSGLAKASLMAWIDLNNSFSTDGVIVGEKNFQIKITSTKQLQVVLNGSAVAFTTILPSPFPFTNTTLNTKQWYHVGATYDGATLKLFLNGTMVASSAKTGAITTDASPLTIGKNPSANDSYFKGKIDEVRVFNIGLTDSQLQRMVYQEIDETKGQLTGSIISKTIAETTETAIPFTNMIRYYRMDTYKDDVIDDLTTPAIDLTGTRIYNHKNIYVQQAPMPFETIATGNFATAVNNPLKDIRGLDVTDNDYSIIKVHHDITETSNNVDLGMFVDSGKNITMNNDTKLQNDWYLKLDGKIDLQGKSQLVQTTFSDLDVTSAGSIERDQQGQSNKYNYNYWSSPVSKINSTSNNQPYTVDLVLRDGTDPANPKSITWVAGYDGSALTSPIKLARYWIYKFDNLGNAYANWTQIGETGSLKAGLGFTLKGSGAVTATQNYTFIGKPNNGLISNTVGTDQLLLTGNPYPSALDADKFIDDNIGVLNTTTTNPTIDGSLYFWQHYASNNSHVLRDYQGGYGIYNKTGGVAPSNVGVDFISTAGTSDRVAPNRFIPVGQGFFVNGNSTTGGNVVFKNSQRAFIRENDLDASSKPLSQIMYKTKPKNNNQKQLTINSNACDPVEEDTYKRIRLGFNFYNDEFHRQVLLGFMEDKANSEINPGYDALNIDESPTDMYFINGDNELAIQGEGYFDENSSYPIGVRLETAGKVSFGIDAIENFDTNQTIFIYDNVTDTYNDIQNSLFEVNLPVGVNDTRFALRFKNKSSSNDKTLSLEENNLNPNDIKITHIQNSNILKITNNSVENTVEKVTLFNINGQSVASWKIENQNQQNIQIPINTISSGIYITKLKMTTGELSKKIIIN